MAEARHAERKKGPKHTARKKEQADTLWGKLKGSALFWLVAVIGFTVGAVALIFALSKLLSGG